MKHIIQTVVVLVVLILIVVGIGYFANRTSEPESQSSPIINPGEQTVVEAVVKGFGMRMKNVSTLAPAADLAVAFNREYGAYVAPELLTAWKADPTKALGRQTSNPYPDSISIVSITPQLNGSYLVEANVIEVTSGAPKEPAAVYPVTLSVEKQNGLWVITSATKGAYSELPKRMTFTGKQTCLSHRDKTGPQTLECAIGFRTDDGVDYALDTNLMSSTDAAALINSGAHVRVQGVVTPVEALSSDRWQKYDMKGILSVSSAEKI